MSDQKKRKETEEKGITHMVSKVTFNAITVDNVRITKNKMLMYTHYDRCRYAAEFYRQNSEEYTQKSVAHFFHISESNLSRSLKGDKFKNKSLLTPEQSNELILSIEQAAINQKPFTKKEVLEAVNRMYFARTGKERPNLPSDFWWKAFKSKHPNVKLKYTKPQDIVRLVAEKSKDIDKWVEETRYLIRANKIKQSNIINIDEKGVLFTITKQKVAFIEKKTKSETIQRCLPKQKQGQHYTIIGGITGDGKGLPLYSILQMPTKLKWEHEFDPKLGVVEVNSTGYVDNHIKLRYLKNILQNFDDKETKLILLDNHSSNYSAEFVKYAQDHNTIIRSFPSNLTHLLQPLDLVVFSSFSSHLKKHIADVLRKEEFFKVEPHHYQNFTYLAWTDSARCSCIMSAWEKSKIIRWSPIAMYDIELATPVLLEETNQPQTLALVPANTQNQLITKQQELQILQEAKQKFRQDKNDGWTLTAATSYGTIKIIGDASKKRMQNTNSSNSTPNITNIFLQQNNTTNNINIGGQNLSSQPQINTTTTTTQSSVNLSSSIVSSIDSLIGRFVNSVVPPSPPPPTCHKKLIQKK